MEELIDKKVDGIALAPVDADRLRKVIDKAVDSGIPVVTFNTDAPESRRMCFVGQDLLTAGRVAGELMGELLDRKGKVLIITGFYENLGHRQRVQGFKEQIQRYFPDIEIIGIYENHDKPQEAYSISRKVLESCPKLKGIYVTAGGPFGVGQAIKDVGKGGIVKLICFDLLEETIQQILKERYGDKLIFWGGGVDTQRTLPFGSPGEVREEVNERCRIFGKGGGYVFSTIHNIQSKIPIENLMTMFQTVREFKL